MSFSIKWTEEGRPPENSITQGKVNCGGDGVHHNDRQLISIGLGVGHFEYVQEQGQYQNTNPDLYKAALEACKEEE